jgi:hypothetical protein
MVGLIAGVVWVGVAEVEVVLVELVVTVKDRLVDEVENEVTDLAWVEELLDLEFDELLIFDLVDVVEESEKELDVDLFDEVEVCTNDELEVVTVEVPSM